MLKRKLHNHIKIVYDVDNYENAVRLATEILVRNNLVRPSYVEAILKRVETYVRYIVVAPKIAMLHARPKEGVIKTCMSLLKVDNGVLFGEDKIFLIFVLGAVDNNSHIGMIKDLMEIIDNDKLIENLISAKSEEEMLKLL